MRKAVAIQNRHEYDDTPFGKSLRQSYFIHHLVPDTSREWSISTTNRHDEDIDQQGAECVGAE